MKQKDKAFVASKWGQVLQVSVKDYLGYLCVSSVVYSTFYIRF